jgi:splicing factor U2AF subunit
VSASLPHRPGSKLTSEQQPHSSRDDHRERGAERGDRGSRGGDREDRHRRRSRSPRQSSRRDYEVDNYSSSRDYRAREREDRFSRGSERRDDRNWDSSYSRRERPRHERDDRTRDRGDRDFGRGGGRDRDFEDRGRGGGGRRGDGGYGGGGRDSGGRGGGRERQKSASPPVKKREPTPDLTSYTSIQTRPRRMTQWDIKPSGYENITAEQAKLSGMFPLPGAPRAAPMDPSKLAAFVSPTTGTASTSGLQAQNSKQAKRLFIYNIPGDATSDEIVEFLNLQLNGLNVVSGINPCLSAQIASNHEYALVEFKTAEDATVVLAMDGVSMRGVAEGEAEPAGLSIRRPKDYITPSADENAMAVDGVSSNVPDSPYKLSITNIPAFVDEPQARELVEAFGALKAFVLVKDTSSEQHRVSGYRYPKVQRLLTAC